MWCHLCEAASFSSSWIGVSDWEISQKDYTRTLKVLEYFSDILNRKESLEMLGARDGKGCFTRTMSCVFYFVLTGLDPLAR